MLNPFVLISALMLLVFAPMPTPGSMPQESAQAPTSAASAAKRPAKPNPEAQAKAKKLYAVDCALCHGETGDGKTDLAKDMKLTLGDWTDSKTLAATTDADMFDAIRKGKGKMPAEDAARATDEEVKYLILYIRSMSKDEAAKPAN